MRRTGTAWGPCRPCPWTSSSSGLRGEDKTKPIADLDSPHRQLAKMYADRFNLHEAAGEPVSYEDLVRAGAELGHGDWITHFDPTSQMWTTRHANEHFGGPT